MEDLEDAVAQLDTWASVDADRNYKLEFEVSRNSWVTDGITDGIRKFSCEVWDPRNGAFSGFGSSLSEAAESALNQHFQQVAKP